MSKYSLLFLITLMGLIGTLMISQSIGDKFSSTKTAGALFDVCQIEITNYQFLVKEVNERHPTGSDVSVLLDGIEEFFGKPIKKEKVIDWLLVTDRNQKTKNSWFYHFEKECQDISEKYSIKWRVSILVDFHNKISIINILPYIQTTNFELIEVPFNFEYFTNDKERQNVLWNLTGAGTPKYRVQELMRESGGVYGDLELLELKDKEKLGYQYKYRSIDFIPSRIAPWEFKTIVIWDFDNNDELVALSVN